MNSVTQQGLCDRHPIRIETTSARHAASRDVKVDRLTSAIENAKREHSNDLRSYLETAAEMALENEFLKVGCCRGGSTVVEWAFPVVV